MVGRVTLSRRCHVLAGGRNSDHWVDESRRHRQTPGPSRVLQLL